MSLSDGMHKLILCKCPKCRALHDEIVSTAEAVRHKQVAKGPFRAICDECYGRSRGQRAMAAYRELRSKLGGP